MRLFCAYSSSQFSSLFNFRKLAAQKQGFQRFTPLVQLMHTYDDVHIQIAALQFINALVTTPEELDVRIHLRNEFNLSGSSVILSSFHVI